MSPIFTDTEKALARTARKVAFLNYDRKSQGKKFRKKIQKKSRRLARRYADEPLKLIVFFIQNYAVKHKKDLQNL